MKSPALGREPPPPARPLHWVFGVAVVMAATGPWPMTVARAVEPPAATPAVGSPMAAASPLPEPVVRQAMALAEQAARAIAPKGAHIEAVAGSLDPRLRLAACRQVQPYLSAGSPPWGRSRVGLRCIEGATPWNVYLPVTIRVMHPSLVAMHPLPAGSVLTAGDLKLAETDLAAGSSPVISRTEEAVGRTLARPLDAGAALRQTDFRARQWFAAGDEVRIVARGHGYRVSGAGQALSPGIEGRSVRVRAGSGRIVTGVASGEGQVDVAL